MDGVMVFIIFARIHGDYMMILYHNYMDGILNAKILQKAC